MEVFKYFEVFSRRTMLNAFTMLYKAMRQLEFAATGDEVWRGKR